MARWIDFDNDYKTMDLTFMESVWWVFDQLWKKGLIYEGVKVMPYSWRVSTPLSNFEANLNYKDTQDPSVTVKFALTSEPKTFILAWTTTPWTIPANLAIALNPKIEYAFIDTGKRVLIVAKELAETFAEDCGIENWTILKTTLGSTLEGAETRHPFVDRASPIVLADYVTTESGTGCVHTAPGHGLDDYLTGQKYGMEIYCPVNDDGVYDDDGQIPDYLVNASVLETNGWTPANGKVMKALTDHGALLGKKLSLIHI